MHHTFTCLCIFLITSGTILANNATKKKIDGMVINMLWNKVYAKHDAKMKEMAIRKIRESGEYDKLMVHLMKVKPQKLDKLIHLVGEVMLTYIS